MVVLRAPRLGYDAAPVLRDVDIQVAPGERLAIIGGNGAGKTTLLRCMAGLLPVPDGSVSLHGNLVTGSAKRAVAQGVGMVFQNPDDQLFGTTVLEDVLFGPRNQGLGEKQSLQRAEAALTSLGVTHLAHRAVEALSFGEKKRVCLAGVVAMQPRVLLLDEPTAGLDPAGEADVLALLARLHSEHGMTQIIATHAIDLVPYLADRVLLLGHQEILADGPPHLLLCRESELVAARLRVPWVTRLGLDLQITPLPCTLEEAREQWAARLGALTPCR